MEEKINIKNATNKKTARYFLILEEILELQIRNNSGI